MSRFDGDGKGEWVLAFAGALEKVLEGERRAGAILDYSVEVLNTRDVTAKLLQAHVDPVGRGWFGYRIRAGDLRSKFKPDDPASVADAWFYNSFPPGKPVDRSKEVTWVT